MSESYRLAAYVVHRHVKPKGVSLDTACTASCREELLESQVHQIESSRAVDHRCGPILISCSVWDRIPACTRSADATWRVADSIGEL